MGKQVSTLQVTGKVGNLVGYKRSGSKKAGMKFARLRPTDIKNPKTQSQQIQRAIVATIAKAYKAGCIIFDHSFEGKMPGAQCMDYFKKINMRALRNAIRDDVKNNLPVEEQLGAVVAPGSAFPTLNPLIVSEGTLQQSLFEAGVDTDGFPTLAISLSAAEQAMTVPAFLASRNIQADDIFTLVGFGRIYSNGAFASQYGTYASQPSVAFGFVRLTVKDTSSLSTSMSAATFDDIFVVEIGGEGLLAGSKLASAAILCTEITGFEYGYIGCIRSRENDKKRSNCTLFTGSASGVTNVSACGIKSSYLLNAWSPEQDTLGQSDLILEGGNF